jgi:hypothetical protein
MQTSAAVAIAIPHTDMQLITLITWWDFFVIRYLLAIYRENNLFLF